MGSVVGKNSLGVVRRWPELPQVAVVVVMFAFFWIMTAAKGTTPFSGANVANSLNYFGEYGLFALALGITMILGEFDISTLGTFALGGMIAVKVGSTNPWLGAVVAVACCSAFGLGQGYIIAKFRMNSMTLTVGGYLITLGLCGAINKNVQGNGNANIPPFLQKEILTIFSPMSLFVFAIFIVAGVALKYTSMGRKFLAMGGARKSSRAIGLPVNRYVTVTFGLSAALASLSGVLYSYTTATSLVDPTLTPFLFGVTAVLIGGVSLSGGRGAPFGIACGALSLSFLYGAFQTTAATPDISDTVYGLLLLIVAIWSAPSLKEWLGSIAAHPIFRSDKENKVAA